MDTQTMRFDRNRKRYGVKWVAMLLMVVMVVTATAQQASALSSYAMNDQPETVDSTSTKDFVELNLYDYSSKINDKYYSNKNYPGFQWNGGAYMRKQTFNKTNVDFIDFGNSKITDYDYSGTNHGVSNTATSIVIKDNKNNINYIDVSGYGVTNRAAGMGLNSNINDTSCDILKRTLGTDGYPALKDGSSLAYLFKDNSSAGVTKKNTESIDGLFQKNDTTGAYSYNSRENHAQYSNNQFTLYKQIITPNFIVYPFGNFLPFNSITSSETSTQVSKIANMNDYITTLRTMLNTNDKTDSQLSYMLEQYRLKIGSNDTAATAIYNYFTGGEVDAADTNFITNEHLKNMYNIDWNVDTNFFFGMEMKMNFTQPKNGKTGNDGNQNMVFDFTGDDDVWVYVDETLFLDLTGIHRHIGGKIDFVNGKVYYYPLAVSGGDVSTTPYQTYTFEGLLRAAGKTEQEIANLLKKENGNYTTFKDYTSHKFNLYYMERGSGSSICRMNFNFPLLKQNSISVAKEVTGAEQLLGEASYDFQVLKADSNGQKTENLFIGANTEYKVYDEDGNQLYKDKNLKTDANGIFSLKAGERAEFSGIKENAGNYYVRELFDPEEIGQFGTVTVSGEAASVKDGIKINNETFAGRESSVKDAADGAAIFQFVNKADGESGSLTISKTSTSDYTDSDTLKNREFDFQVKISGTELSVGTKYKVGTTTKEVTESGIISLKSGETATIKNLLAGSEFEVKEVTTGYNASYTLNQENVDGNCVVGKIPSGAINVAAKNVEKGSKIEVPVKKILLNPDGSDYTYTFKLQKWTSSGKWEDVDSREISFGDADCGGSAEKTAKFALKYAAGDPTIQSRIEKYRILEVNDAKYENIEYDTATYEFEVNVVKTDDGDVNATLSKESDWNEISFTNKVLYALPETGGNGTTGMYIAGLILMLGAGFALIRKNRKSC